MARARRDIQDRAFELAVRVVAVCRSLKESRRDLVPIGGQLRRSVTSVGANLEEATAGLTKADFIAKCSLALKEARETHYWLRLIARCDPSISIDIRPLVDEADQIVAILTTIIRNAQSSNNRGPTS